MEIHLTAHIKLHCLEFLVKTFQRMDYFVFFEYYKYTYYVIHLVLGLPKDSSLV